MFLLNICIRQLRDLLLTDDEQHKHELVVPTGQDIYRVKKNLPSFICNMY